MAGLQGGQPSTQGAVPLAHQPADALGIGRQLKEQMIQAQMWNIGYCNNIVKGFILAVFHICSSDYEQQHVTHLCCFANNVPTS